MNAGRSEAQPVQTLYRELEGRVGTIHLRQRLGIESDREARVFGQGLNFFHIENWYSIHGVIRLCLRLSLLYGRARRNALRIELRRNDIVLPGLAAALDGFTLLHISDLHLDMNPDFPQALSDRVRDLSYDACVLTGDYRYRTYGPVEGALAGMETLRRHLKDPVFGVLGNHDSIRMVPALEAMGIRMLMNESAVIERAGARLHIAGIDDPHYYRADNFERACRAVPDEDPSILLAHSPEVYKHAAHSGFDVMLCGHTHGGQVCLPGGRPLMTNADCPRRYCAGPWRYHQLQGYTSLGAGSSVVDVRLNNRPEVTLHTLRRA